MVVFRDARAKSIAYEKKTHKRRSLGDVIGEVLERANQKLQAKVRQRYPVRIVYDQKEFTVKGKKEIYYVFCARS